jgi:hypothetical protein
VIPYVVEGEVCGGKMAIWRRWQCNLIATTIERFSDVSISNMSILPWRIAKAWWRYVCTPSRRLKLVYGYPWFCGLPLDVEFEDEFELVAGDVGVCDCVKGCCVFPPGDGTLFTWKGVIRIGGMNPDMVGLKMWVGLGLGSREIGEIELGLENEIEEEKDRQNPD